MKLAQEEELLSSNKTAEQRWKDKYEDHRNMQTSLGKQHKEEQMLASGYLTRPSQVIRPQTATYSGSNPPPHKRRQILGELGAYQKARRSDKELLLLEEANRRSPGKIREETKNAGSPARQQLRLQHAASSMNSLGTQPYHMCQLSVTQ